MCMHVECGEPSPHAYNTIGQFFLIMWFNDCVLGKSGQIANLIIAMVDPIPYCSICTHLGLRIY